MIIIDDNPRDRSFLSDLLKAYKPLVTTTAEEVMESSAQFDEPWIITDIQMPEINGVELATQLWEKYSNARILFWSQYNDETYVRALAKLIPPETVYGYVLKNNTAETLLKAVQAVFDECQCWIDPSVRQVQARNMHKVDSLSDAEYEVLIDIALGLTDNTIAERHYLSRRGVQNRLQNLYSKLGASLDQNASDSSSEIVNVRSRAVAIALQRGLINAFELKRDEAMLAAWLKENRVPD